MKGARKFVRGCDTSGSPVQFNFKGETEHKTLGGGLGSLIIRFLVLLYGSTQILAVMNYRDPQISSYTVLEDRSKMETPLNLAENHTKIYFGVYNEAYFSSVKVDPRLGKFEAFLVTVDVASDSESGKDGKHSKELPVYEMTVEEKDSLNIQELVTYSIDLSEAELSGL